MTVFRDQNAGRIQSMKMDNSSIERVEELKYLGTYLTSQNSMTYTTAVYTVKNS